GVLKTQMEILDGETFYVRFGDWFAWGITLIVVAIVLSHFSRRRLDRNSLKLGFTPRSKREIPRPDFCRFSIMRFDFFSFEINDKSSWPWAVICSLLVSGSEK